MPRRLSPTALLVPSLALALLSTVPYSLSSHRFAAPAYLVSRAAQSDVVGTIWASKEARSDDDRDRAGWRENEERRRKPCGPRDADPNRDLMASKHGRVHSLAFAIAKAIWLTGKAKVRACGPEAAYKALKAIVRADELLQRHGVSPTQNLAAFPEFKVMRRNAEDTKDANVLVYYCRLLDRPTLANEIDRDRSVVITDSLAKIPSMASAIKHRMQEIKVAIVLGAGEQKLYRAIKVVMHAGRLLSDDRGQRHPAAIAVMPSYYEQVVRGSNDDVRTGIKLACFELTYSLPEPEPLPHLRPLRKRKR